MSELSVTLADVILAGTRICRPGLITESPLLDVPRLAKAAGFKSLRIKDETAHAVGAFKLRGALNHFLQLTDQQKGRGVFAISSGNHAQAVAYAARQFKVAATILMPKDAPQTKIDKTRAYGAEVILCDRAADRDKRGQEIAMQFGLHAIHPYNDPKTIAGQGTVGLEIFNQTKNSGRDPDAIVVPCGGGGLASGIALTRDLYATPPTIYTAEPAPFDDTYRSLKSGVSLRNAANAISFCDSLLAPEPGSNTLPILLQKGARGLTASDDEVAAATLLAASFVGSGLRLEPSGAAALACALARRGELEGKHVVVIASGANVDPAQYRDTLLRGASTAGRMLPKLKW